MSKEEKEEEKPVAVDMTAIDTYVLITLFINILGTQAWQHLGLRVKPGTDEIVKDLKRAKVAIDCIEFLIDKVTPYIPNSEKKRIRKLLADLQINFVRISSETQAKSSEGNE